MQLILLSFIFVFQSNANTNPTESVCVEQGLAWGGPKEGCVSPIDGGGIEGFFRGNEDIAAPSAEIGEQIRECEVNGGTWLHAEGRCGGGGDGIEREAIECNTMSRRRGTCPAAFCTQNSYAEVRSAGCRNYREGIISGIQQEIQVACEEVIGAASASCMSSYNRITPSPRLEAGDSGAAAISCRAASDIANTVIPSITENRSSCESRFGACAPVCDGTRNTPWGEAVGAAGGAGQCDAPRSTSVARFENRQSTESSLRSQYANSCSGHRGTAGRDEDDPTPDLAENETEREPTPVTKTTPDTTGDQLFDPFSTPSGNGPSTGELASGAAGAAVNIGNAFGGTDGPRGNITSPRSAGTPGVFGGTLDDFGRPVGSGFTADGGGGSFAQRKSSFQTSDPVIQRDGAPVTPGNGGDGAGAGNTPAAGGGGFAGAAGAPLGAAGNLNANRGQQQAGGNRRGGARRALKARSLVGGYKKNKPVGEPGSKKRRAGKISPQQRKLAYQQAVKKFGRNIPFKFDGSKYVPDLKAMKASHSFKQRNAQAVAMYQGGRAEKQQTLDEILIEGKINPNGDHGIFKTMNIYFRRNFEQGSQANGLDI